MNNAPQRISSLRNDSTGELSPVHWLGQSEDGRRIALAVEGWSPVDSDGNALEVECDSDGNYLFGAARG